MKHILEMTPLSHETPYAFCEACRKTDIPTTIEHEGGDFDLVCPTCAAQMYADADTREEEKCEKHSCHRLASSICSKCGDNICSFHDNTDAMCDDCSVAYRNQWRGHGY
jgi:hypothetical protein